MSPSVDSEHVAVSALMCPGGVTVRSCGGQEEPLLQMLVGVSMTAEKHLRSTACCRRARTSPCAEVVVQTEFSLSNSACLLVLRRANSVISRCL